MSSLVSTVDVAASSPARRSTSGLGAGCRRDDRRARAYREALGNDCAPGTASTPSGWFSERAPGTHLDEFGEDDIVASRTFRRRACSRCNVKTSQHSARRRDEVHALLTQGLEHCVAACRGGVREDTFPLEEYSVNHGGK